MSRKNYNGQVLDIGTKLLYDFVVLIVFYIMLHLH